MCLYIPDTTDALWITSVGGGVVLSIGFCVLVSKSSSSYIILGPRSKHCITLVAIVFTGESIFAMASDMISNNAENKTPLFI
jgi:hypothetical protein